MKKILVVVFLTLFSALVFATGASAYIVGWINQSFEVKEPIMVKVAQAPTNPMWPGSLFLIQYEIENQANVPYGMAYGGYITYADIYGSSLKFPLEKQPAAKDKEPSVRLLQKPEGTPAAGAPPFPPNWGKISFSLAINKEIEPYTPYEIVNIAAKGNHALFAEIRPSAEIPPGKWAFQLVVDRNEPNPVASTTPAPATTPTKK